QYLWSSKVRPRAWLPQLRQRRPLPGLSWSCPVQGWSFPAYVSPLPGNRRAFRIGYGNRPRAQPVIVPPRSLMVKPFLVWRRATSRSSWWMTHSPTQVVGRGAGCRGGQACQVVGWAGASVVDGDQDAAWRGPDADGRGRASVAVGVGEGLGDADQQVLEGGGGDAAGGDLRERVPGVGGGPVDQLGQRWEVFERVGRVGEAFEGQGVLVAAAGAALARRRDEAGVGAFDDVEDGRGRGGGVVQAPAPHGEVLPDGVDGRFVA